MRKIYFILGGLLFFHLFLLLNLRYTAWPEMTLWPYLLNQGWQPYRDIVVVYPPALILFLTALTKLLGGGLVILKILTWTVILTTDLLVYWLGKRILSSERSALISLVFYIFWQPYFGGNGLWFDLILAPLSLGILFSLFSKRLILSGLLFGLALVIKQTAFWLVFPFLLTLWQTSQLKFRFVLKIAIGVLIPIMFMTIYLLVNGLLADFWQWSVVFGIFYLPKAEGQVLLPSLKQLLGLTVPYLFFLVALVILLVRNQWPQKKFLIVLSAWTVFGALGAFSRWDYFHLQPSLPFLALLTGLVLGVVRPRPKWLFSLAAPVLILLSLYLQQRFYLSNWQVTTRFYEPDILTMAGWLQNHTQSKEKIYILNSWDHLYALSGTLPAVKPLIHTLPWHLEYPGMQAKYVHDLSVNQPKYVVFQPYKNEGLGSYRPAEIDQYLRGNYNLKEEVAGRFEVLERK